MKLEEHASKYKLFVDRVTKAMIDLEAHEAPVKAALIYEWVQKNFADDIKLLDPSWGSFLSGAAHDPGTRIRRVPGKYTYSLLAVAPAEQPQPPQPPEEAPEPTPQGEPGEVSGEAPKYTKREAALYPFLRDWLTGRGFGAKETSNSKGGGTWGNPDVTGIRTSEGYLGLRDLEVATIEAKISMSGWRQLIFEAVSHKRFAHRAYFAFAFAADEPSLDLVPEVEALRQYAERFRVGILVVFLPEESFKRLHTEKVDEVKIEGTDARVEELWPALYEPIRQEESTQFLWKVVGVADDKSLYSFGED
jgi:hypothetical protein